MLQSSDSVAIDGDCILNRIIFRFRLCLGAWSDHGERTGGFYACNRYEAAKQEGLVIYPDDVFLIFKA